MYKAEVPFSSDPFSDLPLFLTRDQKTLDDFDFAFNVSVKKKLIYDLASGYFVREGRDLLFLGPPGTGKSHLVQAILLAAPGRPPLIDYFLGLDEAGTACASGTLGGVSSSRTERSA